MPIDPNDPGLDGYIPIDNFRTGDNDYSSRMIREKQLHILPAAADDAAAKALGVRKFDFYQHNGAVRQRLA